MLLKMLLFHVHLYRTIDLVWHSIYIITIIIMISNVKHALNECAFFDVIISMVKAHALILSKETLAHTILKISRGPNVAKHTTHTVTI